MTELALDIRGVSKRYAAHVAVADLSLAVPRGAVYGLLGPNGAGKTTTIRMILNIIAPDTGAITVLGKPNTDQSILDRLGYLPEERGLYKKMTVRDVLLFLAELKGVDRRTANASRSRPPRRIGASRRSRSSRAACSRRRSSSARCCTTPSW
jgi:ABC-2 type transport system ATP-binding protein